MSRDQFDKLKDSGKIKPDALFPVMEYDFCKYIWENSPLIAIAATLFYDDQT